MQFDRTEINEMFSKRVPARKWNDYHCDYLAEDADMKEKDSAEEDRISNVGA